MKKSILITGATSGIGYQLVIDYLKAGYHVYAVGRNEHVLRQLSERGAEAVYADLTNRAETIQTIQKAVKNTHTHSPQHLDMVVCCAGKCHYIDMVHDSAKSNIDSRHQQTNQILNFNSAVIMDVMNTNFGTLVHTIEAVLPFLQQSKGRLVALGSASAYVPFVRAEAYASSKSAVHYLMKTLQMSLKPHDIKVSLVIPGFVDTPMTASNDFPMPFLQTMEQASCAIRDGIEKQQEIIEFPKRLTLPLRSFSVLPDVIWKTVSNKISRKQTLNMIESSTL